MWLLVDSEFDLCRPCFDVFTKGGTRDYLSDIIGTFFACNHKMKMNRSFGGEKQRLL